MASRDKRQEVGLFEQYPFTITSTFIAVIQNSIEVNYMSVYSIRIPPEVKEEMDRLKDEINWSKEIRKFIKNKIEECKRRKALQEVVSYIQTLPEAPRGTAQKLVREDRDSH